MNHPTTLPRQTPSGLSPARFLLALLALALRAPAQGTLPPLGVYLGGGAGGAARVSEFTAWFGRPADRELDFFSNDSWAALEADGTLVCAPWRGTGPTPLVPAMTFSVPLTVTGTPLADVAAGLHDSSYILISQAMVANQWGSAYIRLGWEFNGNWMPCLWSPTQGGDPAIEKWCTRRESNSQPSDP